MATINPLDLDYERLTKEKNNLSVPAGRTTNVFHLDNENGGVQEVLLYCTGDLTLEIALGTEIDSMKISDANNYRLSRPNAFFWIPLYDENNNKFCLIYSPFNLQPYQGSVTVSLKNEGSSTVTATKVILRRIRKKTQLSDETGQGYPPYAVQPGDKKWKK